MMAKGVFFDWDGTLVDSLPLLFAAHNHVRAEMGLPLWTREEYAEAIVSSTRELYPKIYGDKAQAAQDMLYAYVYDNHLQQLALIDGAAELMKWLFGLGVPMGLVSNKRHDILQREVEHLGWQKYFGVYNGAGAAPQDKPSGVPLLHALSQHSSGLAVSDIVYVGDTESDLACAAEAGCPVIFIQHPPIREGLVEKYRPSHVVTDLAGVRNALMAHLNCKNEMRA